MHPTEDEEVLLSALRALEAEQHLGGSLTAQLAQYILAVGEALRNPSASPASDDTMNVLGTRMGEILRKHTSSEVQASIIRELARSGA